MYQFNETDNQLNERMTEAAVWLTYDQPRNYLNNGFVSAFIYNFEGSPMDPIEDYSNY